MTTPAEQEVTKVAGLLTLAMAGCCESAMWLSDVADLCTDPSEETGPPTVQEALTLLGMATAAKSEAKGALDAAERAESELLSQYHLAEQNLEASNA